jgi:multidrug efflux pump subunit AcrB
LGVTAQDIFTALHARTRLRPPVRSTPAGPSFIRLEGAYDNLQRIRDTPIVAAGRTLKLSDIASMWSAAMRTRRPS